MTHLYTSLIVSVSFLLQVNTGRADSLELRNGKIVIGTYVKADGDNMWIDVRGTIEAFSIKDVSKLMLGSNPPTIIKSRDIGTLDQTSNVGLAPPVERKVVTVPAGALIGVRLADPVVLGRSNIGRTFQATISESVLVVNQPVIPKGSNALVKLVVDKQSMFGSKTLKLDLVAVRLNGYMIFFDASKAEKAKSKLGGQLANGGAIASIVIGAMAGARMGGLIGAGIGTVAGFSFEELAPLLKKNPKLPAETLLYFVLASPVAL
jgi:hypothetical protein